MSHDKPTYDDLVRLLSDVSWSLRGDIMAPKWGCPKCLKAISCNCYWITSIRKMIDETLERTERKETL